MKNLNRILLFLLALIFIAACHKNKEVDLKPNLNVANDVVICGSAFTYIFNMIVKVQTDPGVKSNHVGWIDSAWVVYDPNLKWFSFEFTGKMCRDSIRRYGKIEAEYDTNILQPGSVTMVLFQNYHNGYDSVSGTDSIINNGIIPGNRLVFTDYIKNAVILKGLANHAVIGWSSETQFITNANSFSQPGDIIFVVKGKCSGGSSGGYSFSATTDSLTDNINCPWILDGIVRLSIPDAGYTTGTIDFIANDGCSNKLIYIFEGNTFHLLNNPQSLMN